MQQLIKTMQEIRARGQFVGVADLNETIASAIAEFRAQLPSGIRLTTELNFSAGHVRGDTAGLRRIVRELLENAVNAMPAGGDLTVATGPVELKSETPMDGGTAPAENYAVITIRDQGTGMNETVRAHIYEPYFTVRPQGHAKGLGLAITAGLVRKCGGFIRCTTAFGQGTAFEIFLRQSAAK